MAAAKLHRKIGGLEDLKSQFDLEHQRELLVLRKHLDTLKWLEQEAADMEEILRNPDQPEDHEAAARRLARLQPIIVDQKELVELTIEVIGLTGDKAELQRQLDALEGV